MNKQNQVHQVHQVRFFLLTNENSPVHDSKGTFLQVCSLSFPDKLTKSLIQQLVSESNHDLFKRVLISFTVLVHYRSTQHIQPSQWFYISVNANKFIVISTPIQDFHFLWSRIATQFLDPSQLQAFAYSLAVTNAISFEFFSFNYLNVLIR